MRSRCYSHAQPPLACEQARQILLTVDPASPTVARGSVRVPPLLLTRMLLCCFARMVAWLRARSLLPLLLFWLGLAGDLDCHPPDTRLVVAPGGVRQSLRLIRNATRWLARDRDLVRIATAAYAPEALHAPRTRTLFFRGPTREDRAPADVAAACFRPNRTVSCREGVYSLGIRQTVGRVLGSHPAVNLSGSRLPPRAYARALREHQFCLTSPGMGFGVRIVDYVASACIPVVVRPGRLLLPVGPFRCLPRPTTDVVPISPLARAYLPPRTLDLLRRYSVRGATGWPSPLCSCP